MQNLKEILTQEELEEYLGVSTNTISEFKRAGLKVCKPGRKNFYLKDSVLEFFKDKEVMDYDR